MNLKRILSFALIVAALSLATTYSTTTSVRGWNSSKVYVLPAQQIYPADAINWTVQYINDNPNVSAHFHATGDNATLTAIIQGSNFDPSDGKWIAVDTVTATGTTANAVYNFSNSSTTGVAYYAYRFVITANDTTTVSAAVKLTE
jgi:hypothetical protein